MFSLINNRTNCNDRFIPRRCQQQYFNILKEDNKDNNEVIKSLFQKHFNNNDFINIVKVIDNADNYRKLLQSALFPEKPQKILNFSSNQRKQQSNKISKIRQFYWDVIPRVKPIIGPPIQVLDMPEFDFNITHHIADWSSTNILGVIVKNEICMWHIEGSQTSFISETSQMVQNCLKWNPDGTQLALGLKAHCIGIWHICKNKIIYRSFCCYGDCDVLCIIWRDNNHIITGCTKGNINLKSTTLQCITHRKCAHKAPIINLQVSCQRNYLLSSSLDKYLKIWKLPTLEIYRKISFPSSPVKTFSWHPWKNSQFATGTNKIIFWDIERKEPKICEQSKFENDHKIDCLTFNPISGELVASYFISKPQSTNERDSGVSFIAVFNSIDLIKEELLYHDGHICYFLWGNGNQYLGSIATDEYLCIWEFFGSKKYKKIQGKQQQQQQQQQQQKLSLKHMENLNIFGSSCIR